MTEIDSNIHNAKGKKSKGMGKRRTPCCDKAHVNRGPWNPAEDLRLISFIQKYGHDNWRALPKQAGLLRCGKSCRLRWVNYLRPDLKRGNFSKEEEETIIRLHRSYGNKWSRIAAHLPGRTDNEIKNVWNTHLKKKLPRAASGEGIINESSVITTSSLSSSAAKSNRNHQRNGIGSNNNMLPRLRGVKTSQTEFHKFNYAPMVNQMIIKQDIPFIDYGSMPQHSEQFLVSNELDQFEDFKMWDDPNMLDLFPNVAEDEDHYRGLVPPNIQLDSTDNNSFHELVTEPDFDLCSILNYDDEEADKVLNVEIPVSGNILNDTNELIADKDIDTLFESLDKAPALAQISTEMCENHSQFEGDVLKSSSPATLPDDGVQDMLDMDYFPMWPLSPI